MGGPHPHSEWVFPPQLTLFENTFSEVRGDSVKFSGGGGACSNVLWCTCTGQRANLKSRFSLATMWVLGIKLRSFELAAMVFPL